MAWLQQRGGVSSQDDKKGVEEEPVPEAVSTENENLVYLGYGGVSGHQFAKLAAACYNVGAVIPRSHLTERFFAELTDVCGSMLFSQVLKEWKASPVFSVQTDEGKDHVSIRVNYLVDFRPVSRLWQARAMQACVGKSWGILVFNVKGAVIHVLFCSSFKKAPSLQP